MKLSFSLSTLSGYLEIDLQCKSYFLGPRICSTRSPRALIPAVPSEALVLFESQNLLLGRSSLWSVATSNGPLTRPADKLEFVSALRFVYQFRANDIVDAVVAEANLRSVFGVDFARANEADWHLF